MFGLKNIKFVKKLSDATLKLDWLKFSQAQNSSKSRDKFMEEIMGNNSFIREDLKLREMVEDMLVKEFSPDIKNIKSYDFLVDSVVSKLKKNQLKTVPTIKSVN